MVYVGFPLTLYSVYFKTPIKVIINIFMQKTFAIDRKLMN